MKTLETFTQHYSYGYLLCDEPEAVGRTVDTREARTYYHNVASYRAPAQWRKVTQSEFRLLMMTGLTMHA